ncbi:MAG: hypothetical protein QOD06_2398 [Candidatus Binatota bacterium]|jgi:glycosyltransferase involved in cell wall biosynthesis|nr:hypothetical protein [Candidatus Binatota bacterium]
MRILFVQKDLYERSIGGSEFYEHHLARELAARHELSIFCTGPRMPLQGRWRESDHSPRVFETVPNTELYPGSEAERAIGHAFDRVLEEVSPAIVHVQDLYRLSPSLPRRAAARGIPVIQTVHEFFLTCPRLILRTTADRLCPGPSRSGCGRCGSDMARERYPGWNPAMFVRRRLTEAYFAFVRPIHLRRAVRHVDRVLSPSRTVRDRLAAAGIPDRKLQVLGYGLPDLGAAHAKTQSRRRRFAFIGNPALHKGIFVLLEAARRVPEADFTIWGQLQRDVEPTVRAIATPLPNVRLAGTLADQVKPAAYAEIDVLVVPSIWYENQPLTILEAFHFGTPVIASRLGGMEELLESGGGWLVAPDDPAALAAAARDLATDPHRIALAATTIPSVKSMTEHAREIEDIHADVLRRRMRR